MSTTTTVDRSQPLPPGADAVESVYSKVSWRIIPLLLIAYMIAFLDRINIGYAQLQMKQTLAVRRCGLWPRRRHLLPRLFPVRSAEQPAAGEDRRAQDAAAHHGAVGHRRRGDGVRDDADAVLYCPLPARRVRGGLLPRRHPLPHLLVPVGTARADDRHLHVGDHDHQRHRRAAVRRDDEIFRRHRMAWPAGSGCSSCRACRPRCWA